MPSPVVSWKTQSSIFKDSSEVIYVRKCSLSLNSQTDGWKICKEWLLSGTSSPALLLSWQWGGLSLPSVVAMLTKGHRNLNSWPRDGKPASQAIWWAAWLTVNILSQRSKYSWYSSFFFFHLEDWSGKAQQILHFVLNHQLCPERA